MKRIMWAAVATMTTAAVGWAGAGAAHAADPPTLAFGAAKTAVTLPAGCAQTDDIHLKPTADGSYRGFLSTRCGTTQKVFYLQRNKDGVWALRTTPYTAFDTIEDVTSDSTGTYVVYLSRNKKLLLGKRQINGSYITRKILSTKTYYPNHASVIASNGQFWVVWNDVLSPLDDRNRDGLWETKTIGAPVTQGPVGRHYYDQGTLVRRANGAVQLVTFVEIGENDPASGYAGTGRASVSDRHGTGWASARKVLGDDIVTDSQKSYLDFGGRLYAVADQLCHPDTAYDDTRRLDATSQQASGFSPVELDPASGVTCAHAPDSGASTRSGTLLKLGSNVWVSDGTLAWKANANGRFSAGPARQLAHQPAGTTLDSLLYRSGRIVRVMSQTSGGTATLVEQVSAPA